MAGRFRPLRADEIDVRIGSTTQKGVSLLLYQDARAAMDILDEAVGSMNWTRYHQMIGDRLYCTIEIYDEEKHAWIAKQDVGTESNTEPEKGQASDSFKRAAVNFGIGRELYTAPFIWISADKCNLQDGPNGKPRCYDKFGCQYIDYDEKGNIVRLKIWNLSRRQVVYTLGFEEEKNSGFQPLPKADDDPLIDEKTLSQLIVKCAADKVNPQKICDMYKVEALKDLSNKQMKQLCSVWSAVIKKECAA